MFYKISEGKVVIDSTNDNNLEISNNITKLQAEAAKIRSGILADILTSPKSLVQFIYFCQFFSFLFGLTAIIGICIIYLKRKVVTGSIYESHFIWQTKTLWFVLSAFIIGWCTSFFVIGFFFIAIAIVWNIYRTIKGYLLLLEDKPILNPTMLI